MRVKSKTNIIWAIIFHALLLIPIIFFASKEGILGKKMRELTVVVLKEEVKKIEEPKIITPIIPIEKPQYIPPAPVEEIKTDIKPPIQQSTVAEQKDLPSLNFSDGAKDVKIAGNPIDIYKAYIEYYLHKNWNQPELNNDYITLVNVNIDNKGNIVNFNINSSGNKIMDKSILEVFNNIKQINKIPPKGFPLIFDIKFDMVLQ